MGLLPSDTPGEILLGRMMQGRVAAAEAEIDRVGMLGAPLSQAVRASHAHVGTTFIVSGFGGTVRGLGPMLRSLARDGIDAHGVAIPGGGLASVHEGVAALDAAIAADALEGPIHLAGHSKGGMVIQEWYRQAKQAQRDRVDSMTLLASSHTGQEVPLAMQLPPAVLAEALLTGPLTSSIAETRAGSTTMRRIAATPIASELRALSVSSARDQLIRGDEGHWEGARNVHLVEAPPDHMGMLTEPRAYEALRANVLGLSDGDG